MTDVRQDPEGLPTRSVAVVAAVTIAVGAAAVGLAVLLTPGSITGFESTEHRSTPVAGVDRASFEDEGRGLSRHRDARRGLEASGGADRDAGLARIPIERAMELVADGVRPPGAGEAAP